MENASGDSCAVSLTFRYYIFIENIWKMLLETPGQFPLRFLSKSSLRTYGKCFWSLLDSFPYIFLLIVY